jgi:hypothetical protein
MHMDPFTHDAYKEECIEGDEFKDVSVCCIKMSDILSNLWAASALLSKEDGIEAASVLYAEEDGMVPS